MSTKKICILHDTFLYKWGGERLILMMWKALNADIASWFFSSGSFDLRKEWFTWKMISVSSEVYKKWLRHIKLKLAFLFQTKFLKNYDIVIFSWDSISGVRNCRKDTLKIYYCHTPPRYIYDLHELYKSRLWYFRRLLFIIGSKFFQYLYERDIKKMDIILTNSKNTQARIKKYLWLDAIVLYPPVDRTRFSYISDEGYFLSFARLADAKRVDKIVEAFKKIPEEKLIVIYGKNDPQKEKVMKIAKTCKNISCITLENNDELYGYIWRARASIYIPIEEDFWMSPVESMSAWKPVIGVNEGGLRESIIHNETWFLLQKDFTIDDIVDAVRIFSPEFSASLRVKCEKQAELFSLVSFEGNIKNMIDDFYKQKTHSS